jgi:biotin operon repressor
MAKAWEMPIPTGQKMVLLALCDHANDDGECYPSQKKLAKKCSMSSRAISNHIKWLHDCGILESERRQTTNVRKSNRYFISLENYQAANSAHANSAHANSAYPNMQNFPSEHANFAPSYIDEPSERTIRVEPSDICDDAFAPFAPPLELEPVADKPPMTAKPKSNTPNPANTETWQAYRAAYLQAYGVEPLRNAKVNGQIANFVKLVGEDKAPHIAAFYVSHPNHWYRTKGHDFGTLLANAQALSTDWQRNTRTTSVQTRQQEKTAANMESHKGAIEILKAKGLL